MRSISSEIPSFIVLIAQTEASQPVRLHLASRIQSSCMASGQAVQDGAQTLKSHSIQKEATQIVCVLLIPNAIKTLQVGR